MVKIPLTQGFFALIDDADAELVLRFKWHASIEGRGTKVYAVRRCQKNEPGFRPRKMTKIRMHRFILGLPPLPTDGLVVDHVNGDGLDNRRENLEIITQLENMNRSENWRARRKPLDPDDLVL